MLHKIRLLSKRPEINKLLLFLDGILVILLVLALMKSSPFQIAAPTDPTINKEHTTSLEAQKIADSCKTSGRETCYKDAFTMLVKKVGITAAEQTLYDLQDIDPQMRHCHVISHEISKVATRQNPSKWRELMEQVNVDTCGGGFLHGILEAHTGDEPNFKVDAAFINETCYKGQLNFRERTCAHILGHLILLDTEGKIELSLPICAQVDKSFQLDCYNGIFMEDSFKLALAEHGFAQLPARDGKRMRAQEERCKKYDDTAGVACWTDMAEIFVEFYNYDPQKAYDLCNRAPFQEARNHCYLKAVILMAVSPNFYTKGQLLSECAFYETDDDMYKHCTDFIISSLMYYSAKFVDRAITLCANIADTYKEFCFKDAGEKLKTNITSREERESYCRGTPERYKNLCVN